MYSLKEIREAINKAWVLGVGRFKKQIEKQAGGDRKSEKYRLNSNINYTAPFLLNSLAYSIKEYPADAKNQRV